MLLGKGKWPSQIGVQTITWGTNANIEVMLNEIRELGFDGVEFYQHPERIGPGQRLFDRLRNLRLALLGLAGGATNDKIKLLAEFQEAAQQRLKREPADPFALQCVSHPPYIYVERWPDAIPLPVQIQIKFGLHPHMFRRIQTGLDAEKELRRYPQLGFLPDTAHLTVAGEDAWEIISKHYDRLVAVHLKDWTAAFGRAYQFYAKGFVPLGEGDVPLSHVVHELKKRQCDKCFVVELDYSENPQASVAKCRDWLVDTIRQSL